MAASLPNCWIDSLVSKRTRAPWPCLADPTPCPATLSVRGIHLARAIVSRALPPLKFHSLCLSARLPITHAPAQYQKRRPNLYFEQDLSPAAHAVRRDRDPHDVKRPSPPRGRPGARRPTLALPAAACRHSPGSSPDESDPRPGRDRPHKGFRQRKWDKFREEGGKGGRKEEHWMNGLQPRFVPCWMFQNVVRGTWVM